MESDQMLWDMLKSHIGHQVCIVANGDILWYTIGTLSEREKGARNGN